MRLTLLYLLSCDKYFAHSINPLDLLPHNTKITDTQSMGADTDAICAKHGTRFSTGFSGGTDASRSHSYVFFLSENQQKDHMQCVCKNPNPPAYRANALSLSPLHLVQQRGKWFKVRHSVQIKQGGRCMCRLGKHLKEYEIDSCEENVEDHHLPGKAGC